MRVTLMFLFALVVSWPMSAQAGMISFDFSKESIGQTTSFSDTTSGLTANFSSTTGTSEFAVGYGVVYSSTPIRYLGGVNTDTSKNYQLEITFSSPITSISSDFDTHDSGSPSTFSLEIFSKGVDMGGVSTNGQAFSSSHPSGNVSVSNSSGFDMVIFSDTSAPAFDIGNLTVTSAATSVPEPSSLLMLATAVPVGLFTLRRVRASRRP